ncbi:MAG: RAMP superfamily CRISPR-associated protein [Acidobacteriota bacterium]|nr:RAMP superfamily CRISPR-associated protein [Acidobacteriota bacterium]
MARHALSRPPGPVERHTPPPHDVWLSELFTGALSLHLEIPANQYVSPATGRLGLVSDGSSKVVAQRAATRAGTPVLPGSGIKGAVRTLYELLSFSCDPFAHSRPGQRCTPQACCDACSLFGLLGYNGRVSFSDAVPATPTSVLIQVQRVPIPWTPDPGKTRGDFRLYDLAEATALDPGRRTVQKQAKDLSRQVYLGIFETRMIFVNLQPQELGRILLAMGLGTDRSTRFLLRLGGVKYDGKGAVKVVPRQLRLVKPTPRTFDAEACGEQYVKWIGAARASLWAETFWPKLEQLSTLLYPKT